MHQRRLVVGVTGASGTTYAVRLLQHLNAIGGIETHVVVSDAAALTAQHELGLKRADIEALADFSHGVKDIGACIASGSFQFDGMVVAPCSAKTLASIACGYADNLISRAADVTLKERRRLVLLFRETPLHLVHLRNLETVTLMGGIVLPPLPSFYLKPQSVDDLVDQSLARVLDLLEIEHSLTGRWPNQGP